MFTVAKHTLDHYIQQSADFEKTKPFKFKKSRATQKADRYTYFTKAVSTTD
jgi:hypothetical protein